MGKFDGYLIYSDLDGTFATGETVYQENINAIKYFTENGGRFAFCTGRPTGYLKNMNMLDIINAPVCILNGAVVYDYESEKVLFEKKLSFTVKEFLNVINNYSQNIVKLRCYYDHLGDSLLCDMGDEIPEEAFEKTPIKSVCYFDDCEKADVFKEQVSGYNLFDKTIISKSSPFLVEFNNINANKGTSLQFSKKYLGDIHTAVGIGDYDNDIPLLKGADLKVAVENAIQPLKEIADIIVKPVHEFAIADLISIIESRL